MVRWLKVALYEYNLLWHTVALLGQMLRDITSKSILLTQ
jgi:hypothetical protein